MARRLMTAILAASALWGCGRASAPDASAPTTASTDTEASRPAEPKALSPTLRKVQARGRLNCGVNPNLPGFSQQNEDGDWRGFDVDLCRAIAAAVLGDSRAVRFTPLDARNRFAALQQGLVDVVARNTAWTFARDAALGVDFAGISFYDTQGFLAPRNLKAQGAAQLDGLRICVVAGADQSTLADYFRSRSLSYRPVPADTEDEARETYQRKECDALTGDLSVLVSARLMLARPDDHVILPDAVSDEPLGPVVREGDDGWTAIVRWTLNSLILAEEFGLTSDSAPAALKTSADPKVRRLLGVEGDYGRLLGLRNDWAYRTLVQVGAYNQLFERNLGAGSPLDMERGRNALWDAEPAGLLYSPPMR